MDQQPPSLAIYLLYVVDGGDEIAHRAFTIFIENTEANKLALRRHPADTIELGLLVFDVLGALLQITGHCKRPRNLLRRVRRHVPFASDNTRDMRAVAVLVVERSTWIDRKILMPV